VPVVRVQQPRSRNQLRDAVQRSAREQGEAQVVVRVVAKTVTVQSGTVEAGRHIYEDHARRVRAGPVAVEPHVVLERSHRHPVRRRQKR